MNYNDYEYEQLKDYHGYEIHKVYHITVRREFLGYLASDEDDFINEIPATTLKEVHKIIDEERSRA